MSLIPTPAPGGLATPMLGGLWALTGPQPAPAPSAGYVRTLGAGYSTSGTSIVVTLTASMNAGDQVILDYFIGTTGRRVVTIVDSKGNTWVHKDSGLVTRVYGSAFSTCAVGALSTGTTITIHTTATKPFTATSPGGVLAVEYAGLAVFFGKSDSNPTSPTNYTIGTGAQGAAGKLITAMTFTGSNTPLTVAITATNTHTGFVKRATVKNRRVGLTHFDMGVTGSLTTRRIWLTQHAFIQLSCFTL